MDSATLAFVALGFLIQIIILLVVLTTRNSLAKIEKKLSQPERPAEGRPERPDFRSRRREEPSPRPDRPRPVERAVPAPVASVDKSLRDINLRLKSAERDQDQARKDVKAVAPESGAPRRYERDSRDNRGGQRSGPGPRRDDRPPREYNRRPEGEARPPAPIAPRPQLAPVVEAKEPVSSLLAPVIEQAAPIVTQPIAIEPESNSLDFQHGRKVTVKRRTLTNEEPSDTQAPPVAPPVAESSPAVEEPSVSSDPQTFGRR